MSEYTARNAADRDRLRRLAALDDAALTASLEEGWTVGASLAHLAFWDRFVVERWRVALERGSIGEIPREAFIEMVHSANFAGLPQWLALAPSAAARDALNAAEQCDALIASLSEEARGQVHDRGLLVDRSPHRGPHLDRVEAALQRG